MQAMMLVKSDAKSEGALPPDSAIDVEMNQFNDEMRRAGVLVSGEGLHPSSRGVRVRYAGGKFTVEDGPFTGAKELVGGFWTIQTKTRAEALGWLERVPCVDKVELRPLYELEDFPVDPNEEPGGWRDKETAAREEKARNAPPRKPGTTRFILLLKSDSIAEAGAPHDQAVFAEMGVLMEDVIKTGALLGGGGLKPSSTGARLRVVDGQRNIVDGPFTETKELIAGYCILQLASRAEAVDFAQRWLVIHAKVGAPDGEIEIRELMDP
jgi:hypothetical protein